LRVIISVWFNPRCPHSFIFISWFAQPFYVLLRTEIHNAFVCTYWKHSHILFLNYSFTATNYSQLLDSAVGLNCAQHKTVTHVILIFPYWISLHI
jgi:hypothetical protein